MQGTFCANCKKKETKRYITVHYGDFITQHKNETALTSTTLRWLVQLWKKKKSKAVKICFYTESDYERSTFGWLVITTEGPSIKGLKMIY